MSELSNDPGATDKCSNLTESTNMDIGTPHTEITIEHPVAPELVRVKPEPLTEEEPSPAQIILNDPTEQAMVSTNLNQTISSVTNTTEIENNVETKSANVTVRVKQEPNIQDTNPAETVCTNHTTTGLEGAVQLCETQSVLTEHQTESNVTNTQQLENIVESQSANVTLVRVKQEPEMQEAAGDKLKQTATGDAQPCKAPSVSVNSQSIAGASDSAVQTTTATSAVAQSVQIKPEPANCIPENIPDDFFDDLLDNADQLTSNLSPPHPTYQTASESILNQQGVVATTQNASPLASQTTIAEAAVIPHVPIRVKIELNKDVEQNAVAAGDEMDNITTPCASPNRSTVEPTLNRTTSQTRKSSKQMRVKDEPNNDVHINTEPIPDDFFDDLLDDRTTTRKQSDLTEIKYSDQLREIREKIRQLEKEDMAEDVHQVSTSSSGHKHKHKKSKKKSRKRERSLSRERRKEATTENEGRTSKRRRSRSRELSNTRDDLLNKAPQFNANYGNLPKVPYLPAIPTDMEVEAATLEVLQFPLPIFVKTEQASISKTRSSFSEQESHENNDKDIDCLPVHASSTINSNSVQGFKRIKLEKPSKVAEPLILTPDMKRQKALKLAAETIHNFQKIKNQCSSSFEFVSTVRKLPNSRSYVTQQIYENRSPLHTINNVRYNFNSASTRFNLREWGLEALPKVAAKVARAVGYDADTLFAKLQASKLTNKYNKIKRDPDDNSESIDETKSSFFTNAMTQTDDVYVTSRRRNANDVGIQVKPACGSITTQTSASTTANSVGTNDDLPLMQIINVLNDNQLMALNDFADLIREPAATAIDMYRLRTRMLDMYKYSQLPSAMSATPPAPAATIHSLPSIQSHSKEYRQQQEQHFVIRDPRSLANFSSTSNAPYAQQQPQRIFASHASFRTTPQQSYVDPRLHPTQQQQQPVIYQGVPSLHQQQQRPANNQVMPTLHQQVPPVTHTNYGRGGMRR